MAYDEHLADRIARSLEEQGASFEEKKMMGGLCFMVEDKMCLGIVGEELMARIGPEAYGIALKKEGCKEMDFTGRAMNGFVYVEPEAVVEDEDLAYWVRLSLQFNPRAKSSKKRRSGL